MKKEIAEKWIEALPNYRQTSGQLRRSCSFCCLGVLCDLYRKEHPGVEWEMVDGQPKYFLGEMFKLPIDVQRWAGLQNNMGMVPGGPALSDLNDEGTPFAEIAQIIQEKWEEL